jgi:hypothetical protein
MEIKGKLKAQASLFIILGVIFIAMILIYFLILNPSLKFEFQSGFDDVDIDIPIRTCIEHSLDNALIIIGIQGGYTLNLPMDYIENEVSAVPYWLYNGIYSAPTKNFIESEISTYMRYNIYDCIVSTLLSPIEVNDIIPTVSIYDDRVVVDVNVIALVSSQDRTQSTGRYYVTRDINLGKIITQATNLVLEMALIQAIPLTYISEQEFYTRVLTREQGNVIQIIDLDNKIKGINYLFFIGISFGDFENLPPMLSKRGPYFAYVGEEMYIKYDTIADSYEDYLEYSIMTFEPYNDMDIDSVTGEIIYYPQRPGRYTAYVTVTDVYGNTDMQFLEVEVRQR